MKGQKKNHQVSWRQIACLATVVRRWCKTRWRFDWLLHTIARDSSPQCSQGSLVWDYYKLRTLVALLLTDSLGCWKISVVMRNEWNHFVTSWLNELHWVVSLKEAGRNFFFFFSSELRDLCDALLPRWTKRDRVEQVVSFRRSFTHFLHSFKSGKNNMNNDWCHKESMLWSPVLQV